jgi:uncharacterized protein CbrC (UPF0167 family)
MNHPYRTASDEQRPHGAYVCNCCQRPWDICVPSAGYKGDHPRRSTCPACYGHGASAMERDRVHLDLWQSLNRAQQRDHNAEVGRLQKRLSELEQELRDRPKEIVERYVDRQELEDARAEADRAFRSREYAWQALCMIQLLHHERKPGRCRCGQRLDRCEIAQIVDRYPGLEKWVKEQYRRLQDGDDHKLPDGHPALIDPHWRP